MQAKRERRRFGRKLKRLAVRYGVHKTDRLGYTRNVSADGLFLQAKTVLPRGTPLQLEMACADSSLNLIGIVAWVKRSPYQLGHAMDSGMGIQLLRPPRELSSLLSD